MDSEDTMYLYSEDATVTTGKPLSYSKRINFAKSEQHTVEIETQSEHLYNKKNKNFKNHILRKESWRDISSLLNLSGKYFV